MTAPDLSDATRAAALRVRETFLPKRSQLADSYAEEAAKAKKNRPKLDALEGDLKSMPLPDGKTLYDWVKGFLDSGETLDKLLSARASAEANASLDGQHDKVRKATIKLLGRFREALRDEVELNTKLPRDLEGKVFGYVDELASRRTKRKKTGGEAGTAEGTGAG